MLCEIPILPVICQSLETVDSALRELTLQWGEETYKLQMAVVEPMRLNELGEISK